jgi:hypothetical protein
LFVERGANIANARIDVGHGLYIPVGPNGTNAVRVGRSRSSPAIAPIVQCSPIESSIVNLRGCHDILPWVQGL